MTCSTASYVEMAKQGWNEEEIELLKKEVELARQTAKAESFSRGDTLSQQQYAMKKAEDYARKIAHDRFHAKLASYMHEINSLVKADKILVAQGYRRKKG